MYSLNQIYFYLTEGCNLACRHCWLAPKFDPAGDQYATLPVDLFEKAICEAEPLGLASVKLTGGEPMLHPKFKQILRIVREFALDLAIETNGSLCTPEIAAEIAESPNRFVSISIDGADAFTHDSIRGVPGSFARAQEAIRNLVAAGTAPQIVMSLMRANAGQVKSVVRMAEETGASSVKFNIVQPTERGEYIHKSDNSVRVEELVDLGRHVDMDLAPSAGIPLYFDYPPAFRPLSRLAGEAGGGTCSLFGIIGVIPSGHYALCGIAERVGELVFGEVGKTPLAEIWNNNEILRELRSGLPSRLSGVCGSCLMKGSCLGSCIAQNYYRKGSLWSPFWFCEQAEKQGLFPVSRCL